MTATIATKNTLPDVLQVRDHAREAGATTTHTLDAIAWTAASHAGNYVTKDWECRLQRATELVRGHAHHHIIEHADTHDFDLDQGFTFDELPAVFAAHLTLFAAVAAANWLTKLDTLHT